MKQNLNPNQIIKLNQIKQLLKQYLNNEIDISRVAEKIVDTLYPWYEYYMPLIASNIDPWQARARDTLLVEDIIASCGEIFGGEFGGEEEMFIECVVDNLTNRLSDP
jgi:hypothetical protein